MIKFIRLIW